MKKSKNGTNNLKLVCRTATPIINKDQLFWTKDGQRMKVETNVIIKNKKYKSILKLKDVSEESVGVYACNARSMNGRYAQRRSFNLRLTPTTTTTTVAPTTTTSTTTSKPTPLNPAANLPCPMAGYCLNDGKCSFIPWLGELSCSCAPGFKGARCERKTTSALYSSLSNTMSNTLCAFGFGNPYHSC